MPNYCKTRTWTLENNIIIQVGANIHFISFNKTTANLTILNRQNSSLNFRPSHKNLRLKINCRNLMNKDSLTWLLSTIAQEKCRNVLTKCCLVATKCNKRSAMQINRLRDCLCQCRQCRKLGLVSVVLINEAGWWFHLQASFDETDSLLDCWFVLRL